MKTNHNRTVSVVLHESAQEAWLRLVDTDIDPKTGRARLIEFGVTDSGRVLGGLELRKSLCRTQSMGFFNRHVSLQDFCEAAFAAFSDLLGYHA